MLEAINILLTMFNMCNVHLLAVNKVQIQIIIEETESGSEISSPSCSVVEYPLGEVYVVHGLLKAASRCLCWLFWTMDCM